MNRSIQSLAAILIVSLIACSQDDADAQNPEAAASTSEASPTSSAPANNSSPEAAAQSQQNLGAASSDASAVAEPMPMGDDQGNQLTDAADLQEAARKNLLSPNKETRLDAVLELDPDDATDRQLLYEALKSDADTEVRTQIAEKLGYGDYPGVVPVLLKALQDPAPEVVTAAIDSLSTAEGNKSSIIKALTDLKTHSDPGVREAAESALDLLKTE